MKNKNETIGGEGETSNRYHDFVPAKGLQTKK